MQLKRKKETILDFAGIFTNSYMVWDDMAEAKNKPTIAEMASTAVNFLQAKAGQEGFFIMIEVPSKLKSNRPSMMLNKKYFCCFFFIQKKVFCQMECQGGRIDAAHHEGHAVRALSETLAFEKAIEVNFKIGIKFSFRPIFMEFFSGSG